MKEESKMGIKFKGRPHASHCDVCPKLGQLFKDLELDR